MPLFLNGIIMKGPFETVPRISFFILLSPKKAWEGKAGGDGWDPFAFRAQDNPSDQIFDDFEDLVLQVIL